MDVASDMRSHVIGPCLSGFSKLSQAIINLWPRMSDCPSHLLRVNDARINKTAIYSRLDSVSVLSGCYFGEDELQGYMCCCETMRGRGIYIAEFI
jgi:hypothetical protein